MKFEDDLNVHYLNLEFSENFLSDDKTIQIQLPYPINKPLKRSEMDVITKYCEDLETHNQQLSILRKDFPTVRSRVMDQSFADTHATVTRGLLNFCNKEKVESPFSCDYNPYYCTGILEHFNLSGSNYLIRPDCKNILRITNIAKPWKTHKLNVEKLFVEPITGISLNTNSGISLLAKQKNEIRLIRMEGIKDVARVGLTKKFKLDVLDAKLGETKVGTVLSNGKCRLYDVETEKKVDLSAFDASSATRFEFIDENAAAVLTLKHIKLVDLRSTDCRLFEPQVDGCNYLSCAAFSNDLVYVGTRHHLIRTDARFLKNAEFCTHLMKFSPCYVHLADDLMCLSSQKVDEKVLFCGDPISSLPVNVPSIRDSLNRFRLKKDILLRSEIEETLDKHIGGVKIISEDGATYLYCVNSDGDIFKQTITKNAGSPDDEVPIENWEKWIDYLAQTRKPLRLTNVVNLTEARCMLNRSIDTVCLNKITKKSNRCSSFLNHAKRRYHKDNLGDLATNFLSIWEEPEEERAQVDLVPEPEVAPLDKVNKWIESSTSYFFD